MLAQAEQITGLSRESLCYLNYLRSVLTQPAGVWEGFYQAQSPSMNFALRYQLAFSVYALAALAHCSVGMSWGSFIRPKMTWPLFLSVVLDASWYQKLLNVVLGTLAEPMMLPK